MSINDACLKKADYCDIDLIFNWANDVSVRQNSFNNKMITYEEHKKWFLEKMESKTSVQYVYYYEHVPIGQIRIDVDGDCGNINYSIDMNYRFQGHGKMILLLIENILHTEYPNVRHLSAKVLKSNIASQKKFNQLGYKGIEKENYITFTKDLENATQIPKIPINSNGGGGNLPYQ